MKANPPSPEEMPTRRALPGEPPDRQAQLTRWVAGLVLLPTIPLLLLSVLALVAFYAAPEAFGRVLSRLPGDEFIRRALIFAPATLFAVVVLAGLYWVEAAHPQAPAAAWPATGGGRIPRYWGRAVLPFSFVLMSAAVLILTLVAPGRTGRLLDSATGGALGVGGLQLLTAFAGLLSLAGLAYVWAKGGAVPLAAGPGDPRLAPWTRASAVLVLAPTVPLLILSVGALWVSYASPETFTSLVDRLPLDDWIRLALLFAPVTLAAILFLGLLVLRELPGRMGAAPARAVTAAPESSAVRQTAAVWVLLGGLALTAALALGLLGAVVVLFLR